MARKKKTEEVPAEEHGLTAEQFAEWELLEVNLDVYKKMKGL